MKIKETVLSLLRHALTFVGGYYVGKGIISNDILQDLIVTVPAAIGAIWGAVDEYKAANAKTETPVVAGK